MWRAQPHLSTSFPRASQSCFDTCLSSETSLAWLFYQTYPWRTSCTVFRLLPLHARHIQPYATKDILYRSASYRTVEDMSNSNPREVSSSADSKVGMDGTGRSGGLQVSDI
jgi:hypothetical protein